MRYVQVARRTDLEPGTGQPVNVNGHRREPFTLEAAYHAIHSAFPHDGASLGETEEFQPKTSDGEFASQLTRRGR